MFSDSPKHLQVCVAFVWLLCVEVAEAASKEFSIETATKAMQEEWKAIEFEIQPYRCAVCEQEKHVRLCC